MAIAACAATRLYHSGINVVPTLCFDKIFTKETFSHHHHSYPDVFDQQSRLSPGVTQCSAARPVDTLCRQLVVGVKMDHQVRRFR